MSDKKFDLKVHHYDPATGRLTHENHYIRKVTDGVVTYERPPKSGNWFYENGEPVNPEPKAVEVKAEAKVEEKDEEKEDQSPEVKKSEPVAAKEEKPSLVQAMKDLGKSANPLKAPSSGQKG